MYLGKSYGNNVLFLQWSDQRLRSYGSKCIIRYSHTVRNSFLQYKIEKRVESEDEDEDDDDEFGASKKKGPEEDDPMARKLFFLVLTFFFLFSTSYFTKKNLKTDQRLWVITVISVHLEFTIVFTCCAVAQWWRNSTVYIISARPSFFREGGGDRMESGSLMPKLWLFWPPLL